MATPDMGEYFSMKGRNIMKRLLYLLVVMFVMATVALMPAKGQADNWVRYDRFNSSFIDPGKWFGQERGQNSLREFIRNIKGGKLRMALVGYSDTGSDDGSRFTRNGVRFVEEVARTMTALKARIRVNHFYVMDCDTNDSRQSMVRARIGGLFFHDGNVPVPPSDLTGDIFADIRIWKQIDDSETSERLLEITYRLSTCSDPDCNGVEDIASETVRTIRRKHWITLGINFCPPNPGLTVITRTMST